jgi:PEP-CTERM motif
VNLKKSPSHLLLASCMLALFSAAVQAESIPLNNPSFETLPQGGIGGLFDIGPIPGWTNSGVSGQFQPAGPLGTSLDSYFNYLPDGPTVAYTNAFTIYQVTNALVQSGYTYTLTVQLGHRLDEPFDSSAALTVGGVPYAAIGIAPSAGNWGTYTATFVGTAANAGLPIEIDLNKPLLQGVTQADFDAVTLTSDAPSTNVVPEPSSLVLLGTGILGLAKVMRRRLEA